LASRLRQAKYAVRFASQRNRQDVVIRRQVRELRFGKKAVAEYLREESFRCPMREIGECSDDRIA
jgi:hypothetical protein